MQSENERRVRFGIIGLGTQGSLYASLLMGKSLPGMPAVQPPKGCVLTAVSARSSKKLEPFEKEIGITCFSDWKEMISSGLCDAVIITLPHFLHHETAIYALEAGIHVLCEKPLCVRASDAQRIITCANEHKETTCAVMFNQRANPLFQELKKRIDSGSLGDIRRSNWIINSWWRPDSYYQSSAWRGTWKGEGGGLVVNQAPHQLDLWLWLCGSPRNVFAKCVEGAYRRIDVENDVTVMCEYATGVTGSFISCTHDPLGTDRFEIDLSRGKIVVDNSTKATVYQFCKDESEWNAEITYREMSRLRRADEGVLYTKEILESTLTFGEDYVLMFENFASHISTGTPLYATIEDGLREVQLANVIQLSSWKKEELAFPCDAHQYDTFLNTRMSSEE